MQSDTPSNYPARSRAGSGSGRSAGGRRVLLRSVGSGTVAVVVAVCAVGAVAASAGGWAEHRSASRGCYPKGSTTIAQDKAGRFYSSGRGWYVCAFKQGAPPETRVRRDQQKLRPSG